MLRPKRRDRSSIVVAAPGRDRILFTTYAEGTCISCVRSAQCYCCPLFSALGRRLHTSPSECLDMTQGDEKLKVEWYSRFLAALHEPSLWEASRTQRTPSYRFLWLRSFHHPVAVRLGVQSDRTAVVTTTITGGQGGYEPGKIIKTRTRKLNSEETRWFLDLVDEVKFWSLPTNPPKDPNVVGLDGAQWVLEGVKDNQYHVVDRWSPEKGEVHTLGITMLIDLAELKLLYQDVY